MTHEDEEENDVDITKVASSKESHPGLEAKQANENDGPPSDESKPLLLFEEGAEEGIDEPTGARDLILTSAAGQTDRGTIRRRNEDAYVIDQELGLYVIADGMGGYAAGDVAARLAVAAIHAGIVAETATASNGKLPRRVAELTGAIEHANTFVFNKAQKSPAQSGMGTTVVAAWLSQRKNRLYLGYVGDSRCYRLRSSEMKQLTKDHTLESLGVVGPMAKHLSRAVGIERSVVADFVIDRPRPEDVYMLCTDGLTKMLDDDKIKAILSERVLDGDRDDLVRACDALILAANAAGGRDNVTVILIRIHEITVWT